MAKDTNMSSKDLLTLVALTVHSKGSTGPEIADMVLSYSSEKTRMGGIHTYLNRAKDHGRVKSVTGRKRARTHFITPKGFADMITELTLRFNR